MVTRSRMERELLGVLRDLAAAELPLGKLFTQLNLMLKEPLGVDASCWHGTDPASGMVTSTVMENLDPRGFERAAYLELWAPEPLTFAGLRALGKRVDSLSHAAKGKLDDSARYRELIAPFGFGDEMRVNFDLPSGCWGAATFLRAKDRGAYTEAEVGMMDRFSSHIGQMLWRSYRGTVPQGEGQPLPGIAVLGPRGHLMSADPRAEAVLAELAETSPSSTGVPSGLITVAEHARGLGAAGRMDVPSRSRVRTSTGQWLTLHASLLEGRPDGQVAIVVTPATPAEVLPMALMSLGLTAREQDVAILVARGNNTSTIARSLFITPATVQDHLKSIFTKAGVRSRREFIARLVGTSAGQAPAGVTARGA
ncbi:helix-turn-helix transcriptional regulator [Myxococcus sp. CA033]|uniref:helix-turn-helix transcriptional regulator n=1 Tax=Myxococcus sp. CA033 TaxID=2741516 RepID=UPI00157A2B3D|nr:helix-turn-helix transcriptional regulator [Myxococcus sp. CA033]NTX33169.1 helix-turn-helix transcriptional regulator [Myxococcus sp. CA033]